MAQESNYETMALTMRQRLGMAALEAGYPKAVLYEEATDHIIALEHALMRCVRHAGQPNAGDGCRAVIRTAKEALKLP